MDKSADERGNTGPTDGIKTKGDAGNERYICKANPAMIDDIGKKHGLKIRQKIFPARNMLWHRKQLPNSLRRVDAGGFGQSQTRAMVVGITAAFTSTYFVGGMGRQWR